MIQVGRSRPDLNLVPPQLRAVDSELHNWARWSRDPRKPAGKCGGLESKYRACDDPENEDPPPPGDDLQLPLQFHATPGAGRTKSAAPDNLAAERVQSVVVNLLGLNHRLALHMWYIHRAHPRLIRRRLRLSTDAELYGELNAARAAVSRGLGG